MTLLTPHAVLQLQHPSHGRFEGSASYAQPTPSNEWSETANERSYVRRHARRSLHAPLLVNPECISIWEYVLTLFAPFGELEEVQRADLSTSTVDSSQGIAEDHSYL